MQPALDALNSLQSTAWKINVRVLEVLGECTSNSAIRIPSVPSKPDADALDVPRKLESMDADERRQWVRQVERLKEDERKNKAKYDRFERDLATAKQLAEHKCFWTPMSLDWRGRVLSVPHFSYPREDYVRGLFLFAHGKPIGAEGLKWLKVHTANCGDFPVNPGEADKISKRPFKERERWADENLHKIESTAADPSKELWWTEADKPFQFLAACIELSSVMAHGLTFETHLPISFDGSCSGLQHLSAMMRDADTAELVNLTYSASPRDLYQAVAAEVKQRVQRDLKDEEHETRRLAQMWMDYGIDRKVVKRNVMTYSYGSKPQGMAEQLDEDLMNRLPQETHPFGNDPHKASWYLAQHTNKAIQEAIRLPASAMSFLQKLARAMAKDNKPLCWTSPAGFPFVNQYSEPDTKQVKLWLHDQGTRFKHVIRTTIGELPEIDQHAAVKGIAPNFVHACDAAHLMLTVNTAVAEGITSIVTVHDSFSCLPSEAERFRRIIREQFVRMYEENDVLAQVLDQARKDLGENAKDLPPLPTKGSLDIKGVFNAEYAFA